MIGEIVKISMLGIVGVLIAIQFKIQKPEYSIYIGMGIALLIFWYALQAVATVLERLQGLEQYLGSAKTYLKLLLKVVGISYLCEFSASICKDAGFSTVAEQIEVLGKLSVLLAGLPVLFAVVEQLQQLW